MTETTPYASARDEGEDWPTEPPDSETDSWIRLGFILAWVLSGGFAIAWAMLLILGLNAGFGLQAATALGLVATLFSAFSLRKARSELREELAEMEREIAAGRARIASTDQVQGIYREVLQEAHIGWYRLAPDGILETASSYMAEMLGYTNPEALKHAFADQPFPLSPDRLPVLRSLQATGEIRGLTCSWLTASGEPIRVAETARMLRDEFGRDIYTEGFVRAVAPIQSVSSAPETVSSQALDSTDNLFLQTSADIPSATANVHKLADLVSRRKSDVSPLDDQQAGAESGLAAADNGNEMDLEAIGRTIRRQLSKHHGDEPAFMAELIAGFTRTATQLQFALAEQLDRSDFDGMMASARSLKSSCHFVGLGRLAALCKTLETAARETPVRSELEALTRAIRNEMEKVQPALANERATLVHEATFAQAS